MRERTYWPKLCLLQMARPAGPWGDEAAFLVDPLALEDLEPVFALMRDPNVVKVFHAARQDVEIFVNLMGDVPSPLFDTQVAAMVCGYGDQVGYETLVKRIVRKGLDKSSRFTDWSRRPLNDKQLAYALGDVTHLRVIYERLSGQLTESGRESWVAAEMATLTDVKTYIVDPEEAWRRIKTRSSDPKFLTIVKSLAEWREEEARRRDQPRGRILKDDAILEIAANRPKTREALLGSRSLQREGRKPEVLDAILAAIGQGENGPLVEAPPVSQRAKPNVGASALADLLRVLLKAKAEDLGVAQRLIASSAELDALAAGDGGKLLEGWRREAFGDDAMRLINGEIALSASRRGVKMVELDAVAGGAG